MRDLIFVSMEDWDEVWRRNQFICAELARRNPTMRILFVGLPRNVSNAVRRGRWRTIFRARNYLVSDRRQISVTHPLKLLPDSLRWGRIFNEWLFRRQVHKRARQMKMVRPVLWVNPHSSHHLVGRLNESISIYDITDDWIEFTQSEKLRNLVKKQDQCLCEKADNVIVCSAQLLKLKKPFARKLDLIPNGVDVEHYATVMKESKSHPGSARAWLHPVLGYTGTVHPDRVDVPFVRELAAKWRGTIVLVGPNHLTAADAAVLSLPNIKLIGPIPYADIPTYMSKFDVCIVPHRMTAFTESLNPIKLWEYLAAGKPFVSTNVSGFRDFPAHIEVAETADEFLAAAERGLQEDAHKPEARRAEARKHTWQSRVADIERVMKDALARKGMS